MLRCVALALRFAFELRRLTPAPLVRASYRSESDYIPGVVGERPSATSASAKPQRAAEVFQSTSVRTVFPSKKVLTCRDDETVDKAFKVRIGGAAACSVKSHATSPDTD